MPARPRIIVLSKNDETEFRWLSDGWYDIKSRIQKPKQSEALKKKAYKAIKEGKNVLDVIKRLRKAGFSIKRDTGEWEEIVNRQVAHGQLLPPEGGKDD